MNNIIHLICKVNADDNFSTALKALEVNLSNKKNYHYTFGDTTRKHNSDLKLLPQPFSNEGLDLLYLSLFVYFADRRIKREQFPDAWTRNIKLYFPVLSKKWQKQKELIEEMLSFLSGDIWEIEFRQREFNDIEKGFQRKQKRNKAQKIDFEKISMLSGGLDSFIGAIDLLEQSENILFVNHYGGGPSGKKFIEKVQAALEKKYKEKYFKVFKFHAAPTKGEEDTTRTRSFMFFAHAIAVATALDKDIDLIIPENGLISLNVPLTNSRLGSSSTRTTHPYYMQLLQRLLTNLNIKVKLQNPYQFKTKGEMIYECNNMNFLKNHIVDTMSCSHSDYFRYLKAKEPNHCGICLPCVIRRAALKKAKLTDKTDYWLTDFSSGQAKTNLNVYKLGIKKYQNIRNISLHIQKAGPLIDNIDSYQSLYKRGMDELINFLSDFDNEI